LGPLQGRSYLTRRWG